ncbi:MAG TPA: RNA 2',3'-cyclic phosphodiesterase [Thermoanaerobaculia bacterium]|jgi:2'-5' RNA ligase|nr:RNA 2',3'-cyclic phosphodiesterase [Thermoanaerobaculia bacterium]
MRLFLASTFPEPALRALNERVDRLKPRLPKGSWLRAESQHLTFAFLGEQDEPTATRIGGAVAEHLQAVQTFEASLHGCGFFPNRRHARVGWCGVEPQERFTSLAAAVRAAIRAAGVAFDENEFRPHLTLLRIRDHWPPLAIETFEKGLGDFRSDRFSVDRVTLYTSKLDPRGAIHTPLREFPLAA